MSIAGAFDKFLHNYDITTRLFIFSNDIFVSDVGFIDGVMFLLSSLKTMKLNDDKLKLRGLTSYCVGCVHIVNNASIGYCNITDTKTLCFNCVKCFTQMNKRLFIPNEIYAYHATSIIQQNKCSDECSNSCEKCICTKLLIPKITLVLGVMNIYIGFHETDIRKMILFGVLNNHTSILVPYWNMIYAVLNHYYLISRAPLKYTT